MKTSFQIFIKLCALVLFFACTPFLEGIKTTVNEQTLAKHLVYTNLDIEPVDLQDSLNVISVPKTENALKTENVPIEETETPLPNEVPAEPIEEKENPPVIDPIQPQPIKDKSIYIYNTHQQEAYIGELTVYNAAQVLADKLRTLGYTVIVEDGDFVKYGQENEMDYNMSYQISRKFITDAIMNNGGFDLIIDFHRDSVPRESTYITVNGIDYAKMMCVIGGLTDNSYEITKTASTLYDSCNALVGGIMKNTMTREAYYNQDMSDKMLLIEVGSDNNTFDEVKNSVDILALGIAQILG